MSDTLQFTEEELYERLGSNNPASDLMHLATLEVGEKTYMALANIQETERGLVAGVVIVREKMDDEGKKNFTIVNDEKEIEEVIPCFMQAFMPDAEMDFSKMFTKERPVLDEDGNSFVFDYSDDGNGIVS